MILISITCDASASIANNYLSGNIVSLYARLPFRYAEWCLFFLIPLAATVP